MRLHAAYTILFFALILAYCSVAMAARVTIDNNTRLTLEVVKLGFRGSSEIIGVVPHSNKQTLILPKGSWTLRLDPVLSGGSTEKYRSVTKNVVLYSESDVITLEFMDRDFISEDPEKSNNCDPTMSGKYKNLLKKISVPKDERVYGKCHDYGWWGKTSYAGYTNLPKGYWTYSHPHWYIWQNEAAADRDLSKGCAKGKYKTVLHSMPVPEDRQKYGDCYDYGWWRGTSYKGVEPLPPGFWVYQYPYWHIYKSEAE